MGCSSQFADISSTDAQQHIESITDVLQKFKKQTKILLFGHPDTLKSDFLEMLNSKDIQTSVPAEGFQVRQVRCKKVQIVSFDTESSPKFSPLHRNYYQNADAILYFVNYGEDKNRIEGSKCEIKRLLSEDELQNALFYLIIIRKDQINCNQDEQIVKEFSVLNTKQQINTKVCGGLQVEDLKNLLRWVQMR